MARLAGRFGVAVVTLLFAASCGGDESPIAAGDDEEAVAEVMNDAPVTTLEQPSPTTTPAAVDPEDWVDSMNRTMEDHRYEQALAFLRYTLEQQDNGFFHITFDAALWREEATANAAFTDGLPEPPAEFADLAEAFKEANLALADRWAVAADELEADAEAEALENYEVPQNWETYIDTNADAEEAVATACFALRDAVIDSGFGLINCVGGGGGEFEPRNLEDCLLVQRAFGSKQCPEGEDDGDPSTVELGESELAAGVTYTFNAFDRPFALTTDEPTRVTVQDSLVEIAPVDADLSMFWILAVDEIADPATIVDNPNGLGPVIDLPDDFGGWVEGLPFEVVSEGQSTFGDATVPYWRLEPPTDTDIQGPPEWFHFAEPGAPLGRGGVFWLVAHPDGPLIVYTLPFAFEPSGQSADEKFAYVEATLLTLELIAAL